MLNELGEVTRSVGSAPNHLIANWVLGLETTSARPTHDAHETSIGRWVVRSKSVRIRQRDYVFVLAVFGEPGAEDAVRHAAEHAVSGQDRRETDDVHGLGLILDTSAKLLQAFEGFETFSMSTHREESARLMRDLEVECRQAASLESGECWRISDSTHTGRCGLFARVSRQSMKVRQQA